MPGGGDPQAQLAMIGYGFDAGLVAVVEAFQRRWRPPQADGVIDRETGRLIAAVAARSLPPSYLVRWLALAVFDA